MYFLIIWSMGFISRPLLSPFLVHKLESFPHFRTFFVQLLSLAASCCCFTHATSLWSPSDLMRPAYGHLLIWRLTLKQGLSTTDDFPESPPLMWCSLFLGICPVVTASEDAASVHGKREYCRMTIKKYPGHSAHRAEVEGLWFRGWNRF